MLTGEQEKKLLRECVFRTSRSGGKGGQNVNKVESRVEITFSLPESETLTEAQKELILSKHPELGSEGTVSFTSSRFRSQLENKEDAKKKLLSFIARGLKQPKKRRASRPTRSSKEKKLKEKKQRGEIKALRRKPL
jgi:ribosome-associated protein